MSQVIVVGRRYGRLVTTRKVRKDSRGRWYWQCSCDCGGKKRVRSDSLVSGKITQCQPCTVAQAAERRKRHGLSDHELYDTWKNMMDRCYTPTHRSYPHYGGRGIRVEKEWHDVTRFITDMPIRPAGWTLDRIDNNGNYGPDNCRWASRETQANNTSVNHRLTYRGATRTIAQWSRIRGLLESTIRERINAGWTVEKALSGGNLRREGNSSHRGTRSG